MTLREEKEKYDLFQYNLKMFQSMIKDISRGEKYAFIPYALNQGKFVVPDVGIYDIYINTLDVDIDVADTLTKVHGINSDTYFDFIVGHINVEGYSLSEDKRVFLTFNFGYKEWMEDVRYYLDEVEEKVYDEINKNIQSWLETSRMYLNAYISTMIIQRDLNGHRQ